MTRLDWGVGLFAVVFAVACASNANNSAPKKPTPVESAAADKQSDAERAPQGEKEIDLRALREEIHDTAFVSLSGEEDTRGRYATIDEVEAAAPLHEAIGDLKNPRAKTMRSRMKVTVTARDQTDLGERQVRSRVHSRYLSGMKRCHERVLKRHPQAAGTMVVRFTVGETGRTTKAHAKGFDTDVADCIRVLITGWRFPSPTGSDGAPSPARFELAIVAKPGS